MRKPTPAETLEVTRTQKEAKGITSLFLRPKGIFGWRRLVPGQFIMVWIPGLDEIPMSLSYCIDDPLEIGITVQNIGEATEALCSMKEGDLIGIRGPFGNGFQFIQLPEHGTVISVSGGVGGASTILAMEQAYRMGLNTINLVGARSSELIPFKERWGAVSDRIRFSTDDGTVGHKGPVTDLLDDELSMVKEADKGSTIVITCGPEMMMKGVLDIMVDHNVSGQFSLERLMKCGIGVCDSCSLGGLRVCVDGPVFTDGTLRTVPEFGLAHRDRSGRSVPIKECI